jgi:hypothetical protein
MTSATSRIVCWVVWISLTAAWASAGEDGLGRWYPRGGCNVGKYRYPYSFYTAEVPQRPGHGYFPTYWRDWHENAHTIFSEPEHTLLPERKKPRRERPTETLPEPGQREEEEQAPSPPTTIPEIPPQEAPEFPTDNMPLPGGQPGEPTAPSQPPAEQPPQQLPPQEEPVGVPQSAPGLPTPTAPGQSLPQTPSEPPSSPNAPQTEGPSLYRQEHRERSLAQQATAFTNRPSRPTQREALRALEAGFNTPATLRPEPRESTAEPAPLPHEPALFDQSSARRSGNVADARALQPPRRAIDSRPEAASPTVVLRATYAEPGGARAAAMRLDQAGERSPGGVRRADYADYGEKPAAKRAAPSASRRNPLRDRASDSPGEAALRNPLR